MLESVKTLLFTAIKMTRVLAIASIKLAMAFEVLHVSLAVSHFSLFSFLEPRSSFGHSIGMAMILLGPTSTHPVGECSEYISRQNQKLKPLQRLIQLQVKGAICILHKHGNEYPIDLHIVCLILSYLIIKENPK